VQSVDAALWYLESHYKEYVNLDAVAEVAGVSRFHLARAFRFVTGHTVMGYLRGRRLSEAARRLAAGDVDVLDVALDCGYGSHEAFTRAFREQFGVTPQLVRRTGDANQLELVEAMRMNRKTQATVDPARIVDGEAMLIAGIARTHRGSNAGMPAQWQEFTPYLGHIAGQVNGCTYGVLYNDAEGSIDYLTGVAVRDFTGLPAEFSHLRIAPQRYAVFEHAGHVATIGETWGAIWSDWFPRAGHEAADAPMFERYPETFDGRTGIGGFEIWIPLRS
jgi:AraC family transcriptional regulator